MHFLLLFILSILSVSISAVPQGEDVSADQFDYSNSEVASNDPGGEDPLIPAGDTANWIDFSNPTDNIAGQNSLLPTAETANENDQMPNAFDSSSFFASNAAGQIKPPCKPNLASRDESDDLILGNSLFLTSNMLQLTRGTPSADSGACAVRTDPNLLNNERLPPEPKPPKRDSPHEPKGSQQRFRTSDQDYIGSDKDKHSCESGYQYACCLFPLEALLGDVKHCVWCKKTTLRF